jgi:hypothetical protein
MFITVSILTALLSLGYLVYRLDKRANKRKPAQPQAKASEPSKLTAKEYADTIEVYSMYTSRTWQPSHWFGTAGLTAERDVWGHEYTQSEYDSQAGHSNLQIIYNFLYELYTSEHRDTYRMSIEEAERSYLGCHSRNEDDGMHSIGTSAVTAIVNDIKITSRAETRDSTALWFDVQLSLNGTPITEDKLQLLYVNFIFETIGPLVLGIMNNKYAEYERNIQQKARLKADAEAAKAQAIRDAYQKALDDLDALKSKYGTVEETRS